MDQGKISPLPFDLNSEPENSYNSTENQQTNLPIDLNSAPESLYAASQNQLTNSCLSIDLNSVPESSFLFIDLNLAPESSCLSSPNQQTNSSFQSEAGNQQHSFHSKRKRLQNDVDNKDEIVAKRIRADREKLRRDKLNNCFQELGDILDADRHKNNKRIILADAINVLKDLTSELSRLKIEHAAVSEEARELIQEKSELELEKASLKADIENLELQFQHSLSLMVTWAPTDPSELAESSSYPIARHSPSGAISIDSPSFQPISFFKDQSGEPSSSGSTFSPYLALATPDIDKSSTSIASTSYNPSQRNFESRPSSSESDKVDNLGGVATDLELMPGSISNKLSPRDKGKRPLEDEETIGDGSFLSRHSSSQGFQGNCSNSMRYV